MGVLTQCMKSLGALGTICGLVTIFLVDQAVAKTDTFDRDQALSISEEAVGRSIGRYGFLTTDNRTVQLSQFFGKPLIISLIYTGCADICPMVSETLADAVDVATDTFGVDAFNVVTIGFDSQNDTPERMRAYARSHGINMSNWHFLAGSGAVIEGLAEDMGFIFMPSAKGYDHMTRTSVIDRTGVIYRHIYGEAFAPPQLIEPLKDIIFGRLANASSVDGIVNQIRLFCTIYDPASGRYRFDYSIFIAASTALLAMAATGGVVIRALINRRRQRLHLQS